MDDSWHLAGRFLQLQQLQRITKILNSFSLDFMLTCHFLKLMSLYKKLCIRTSTEILFKLSYF